VRKAYHDLGLPYLDEDWGPRSETGESVGRQSQDPERRDILRTVAATPDQMWWWERHHYPWRQRSHSEEEWLLFLEGFFAPYIAMLSRPKGNLVRQVYGDRSTYAEAGALTRLSRQGAQQATERALRDLTRLIANDDPDFVLPTDKRRRDYEAETTSARRVFLRALGQRD
jgi:hypothetical protein